MNCKCVRSRRLCKNNPIVFCYICKKIVFRKYKKHLISKIKSLYYAYFGCAISDQDKHWAPHFCCVNCSGRLQRWVCWKKCFFRICSTYSLERTEGKCYRFIFLPYQYIIQGHSHKTRKNIQHPYLSTVIDQFNILLIFSYQRLQPVF